MSLAYQRDIFLTLNPYICILMSMFQLPVLPSLKKTPGEYKPTLHVEVRLHLTLTKRSMPV